LKKITCHCRHFFIGMGLFAWMMSPGLGHSLTPEDVFTWTMQQMNIEHPVSQPGVKWVGSAELQNVFIENNRKAYLQWKRQYGPDEADAIMRTFLNEILGMFVVETQEVFVGDFLEPCRRQAILAHEYVHYLQLVTRGADPAETENERLRWARELEAQTIEKLFIQQFCASEFWALFVSVPGR
jgi:hypothetical protein